jgi:hypothetical protein
MDLACFFLQYSLYDNVVTCCYNPFQKLNLRDLNNLNCITGDQKPPTEGALEEEDAAAVEEAERRDSVIEDPLSLESDEKKKQKRKHIRHHYHRRKYSLQEDGRVRAGSDFSVESIRRISIQPEEASMLQEQDIDDLTSNSLY